MGSFFDRIFHVILTIIFNFYVLRDLEKYLGWLATATLYIGSGIGGNIISALFVPYSAEVMFTLLDIILFLWIHCNRLDQLHQCLESLLSFWSSLFIIGTSLTGPGSKC